MIRNTERTTLKYHRIPIKKQCTRILYVQNRPVQLKKISIRVQKWKIDKKEKGRGPFQSHSAIKIVTSLLSREDLRILYFSCVHSIMTYGVIYYVHMRELGLCFYFLCFVGFIIRCTLRYNYFMSILH